MHTCQEERALLKDLTYSGARGGVRPLQSQEEQFLGTRIWVFLWGGEELKSGIKPTIVSSRILLTQCPRLMLLGHQIWKAEHSRQASLPSWTQFWLLNLQSGGPCSHPSPATPAETFPLRVSVSSLGKSSGKCFQHNVSRGLRRGAVKSCLYLIL